MEKGWIAGAVVAGLVLAGCGGSSGGGSDEPAKATTTAAPTTTEVDGDAAAEEYQSAVEDADAAIDDEIAVRDDFAGENDLDGAIDSSKDLRNALFDFDAQVREIAVPSEQESAVNTVLTETGRYIEVLDDYVDVSDIPDYNDQIDAESEIRISWYDAVNELAGDLGADGVENEVDDTGSTPSSDEPVSDDPSGTELGDEIPAGEVVRTTTVAIEVPEGFTGTGFSTIQLKGEDGMSAGIYDVYPEDEAASLDEVAKASAEGAAEKSGDEIASGPREITINGYPAVGYAYESDDGISSIDFYIEAEDGAGSRFHLLSVVAPDAQIQAAMDAVEAVFPTLEFS